MTVVLSWLFHRLSEGEGTDLVLQTSTLPWVARCQTVLDERFVAQIGGCVLM